MAISTAKNAMKVAGPMASSAKQAYNVSNNFMLRLLNEIESINTLSSYQQ